MEWLSLEFLANRKRTATIIGTIPLLFPFFHCFPIFHDNPKYRDIRPQQVSGEVLKYMVKSIRAKFPSLTEKIEAVITVPGTNVIFTNQ
jgi:hypothetical protein